MLLPCIGNRHRIQEFDLESPAIDKQPIDNVDPRTESVENTPEHGVINNPRKKDCQDTSDTNATT